jgi:RHS repeat-associated protein
MLAEHADSTSSRSSLSRYFTSDQLGTPRVITNNQGAIVSRHDYMPFGEEITSGTSVRSVQQGYVDDGVRQKFTGKERDSETGLDYFGARHYASTQGRFTSPDPLLSSGSIYNSQTWNRYTYTLNNPHRYIDPSGMYIYDPSVTKDQRKAFEEGLRKAEQARDHFKKGSREYNRLDRAIKAYGAAGVDNGVTIKFGKTSNGSPAATFIGIKVDPTGAKATTSDYPTGQDIVVTFDPNKNKSTDDYALNSAHEGSHVADGSDLIDALPSNTLLTSNAAQAIFNNTNLNLSIAETEMRAFEVSSFAAQGLGKDYDKVDSYEIWNSSWSEAEKPLKRYLGISGVLSNPTGYYQDKIQRDDRLIDQ